MSSKKSQVTLHKAGRFIKLQANDAYSADVVREIEKRKSVPCMRNVSYYNGKTGMLFEAEKKVEIWRWLEAGIETHPILSILDSYGVSYVVEGSLKNYMEKENRRQILESTPFPITKIVSEEVLFDRCAEGTILTCIKDFGKNAQGKHIFVAGNRYMVTSSCGEGNDSINISTSPVNTTSSINLTGNGAKYSWTMFAEPIDTYFTDSESVDLGKSIPQLYGDRVKVMKKKLKKMKLPLYEHVEEDAAMMALKRNNMNAYLMRMAKTSCAIATVELSESKKIGVVSPGNARLFWSKEFDRMGFKEGVDYKEIRTLEDLDMNIKYQLLTYTWLSLSRDPKYKARIDCEHMLKPSVKTITRKKPNIAWSETETIEVELTNDCPHCKKPMERLLKNARGIPEKDARNRLMWTTKRGYMCRNKACEWHTDNRKIKTDWKDTKRVAHKGGYIDYELARHVNCDDIKVKARMCPECHTADGTWQPARYKRLKKKFTHVILDESHATKDASTETSNASLNLRARRRQALTGTPMSNSAMDLYHPLHWVNRAPNRVFPFFRKEGYKEFNNRFCDSLVFEKPVAIEKDPKTGKMVNITKTVKKTVPFLKNPPDFWRFTSYQIRRRSYADPLFIKTLTANGRQMPKVDIKTISCPMDTHQATLMLAAIRDFKGTFEKISKEAKSKGNQVNPTLIISQMSTMKVTATCPEMINDKAGKKIYEGPAGGGKLPFIKSVVDTKIQDGGKVLILSDFLKMQQTVAEALSGYGVIRFNTGWDDEKRREAFDSFQSDPEKKVFVAGSRAIREGVDLSAADTVICCDLLWSPAFQTQAWSRVMAPTVNARTCSVYIMISTSSLDEHIYNVFYSKLVAAEQALDRKVLIRRAEQLDIKWFVDRVLEEETAIIGLLRDAGEDTMLIPALDLAELENRMD